MDKFLKKYHYDVDYAGERYSELCKINDESHDYHFVGRVGQFCPIKPGCGGGILYRVNDSKNYAAPGSSGFRWLESEVVKNAGKEKDIDRSFYENLINDAIDTISKYGDFEWFVSDDPYVKDFVAVPKNIPEEIPFA